MTSFAFGYKGTRANDEVLNRWFKNRDDIKEELLPDGFMFFNAAKMVLRWDDRFKNGKKYRNLSMNNASVDESLGWQLSVFVACTLRIKK